MLDLRDDGTIIIDFDGTEETPARQVTLPRPVLGVVEEADFKRAEIVGSIQTFSTDLLERDPAPSTAEMVQEGSKHGAALTVEWWLLVAKLLAVEFPDPAEWPPFMVYGKEVIPTVIGHWKEVPLARGGKRVPRN